MPLHLAGPGVQCIDVGSIIVRDPGGCVGDAVLHKNAGSYGPRGHQRAVDRDQPLGRGGAEPPQQPAGLRLIAVHPAVAGPDESASFPDGRRHANGPARIRFPSHRARAGVDGSHDAVRPACESQASGSHRRRHARQTRDGGRPNVVFPKKAGLLRHGRRGFRTTDVIRAKARPVTGRDSQISHLRWTAAFLEASGLHDIRSEVEVPRRAEACNPIERQLTIADGGPPVQQPVGDGHAFLTDRTHRRYPLRPQRGQVQTDGPALRPEENRIGGARRTGAGATRLGNLSQHLAGQRVELQARMLVDLAADAVQPVVTQNELEIAVWMLPQDAAVLCRNGE